MNKAETSKSVFRKQSMVYYVPGGQRRFTKKAAYNEAAKVRMRKACYCDFDPDVGWENPCRFHEVDGYGEKVKNRLARWLTWADGRIETESDE